MALEYYSRDNCTNIDHAAKNQYCFNNCKKTVINYNFYTFWPMFDISETLFIVTVTRHFQNNDHGVKNQFASNTARKLV